MRSHPTIPLRVHYTQVELYTLSEWGEVGSATNDEATREIQVAQDFSGRRYPVIRGQ